MAGSYSVEALLSAKDKGFSSTLKSAMGNLDSLGSKIKSGLGFGFLSGVGQAAFNTIKNSVSGVIGEIDSANATWKTFEGNMKIIGKSSKSINKVKGELQSFAETTVYSSSDMATTYAQMAAVGVKNTTKLVKGFGGLAAAAENPQQAMKTLSQQGTQMAAKPKVAWQDFKLMLEQTPAGIAAVAKEMGMSTSEMVTAVQDGKIKTEDFFKAITKAGNSKAFQKLATQPKTVGQAMDGLKETIGNKLTPAFDVLSQEGIKAVNSIANGLGKIDANALANKIKGAVSTIKSYWNSLKTNFAGVGTALKDAGIALGEAFGIIGEKSGSAGNEANNGATLLEKFGSVCKKVAGWITTAANWIEKNADTIAKVAPYIAGGALAFKGFKIVNSIAPGLTSFAGSLLKMAGGGIASLAGKLFGISVGQKAVGTASTASNPSILQSAVAFLAMGAGILLAAGGIALLAQSAIALAAGGWGAIAVMAGLILVMAGLAIGAAILGPALTAGAIGFIAFGAAVLLVGAGILMAGAGISLLVQSLPLLVAFGLQACIPFMALGGALAVFSVGAALAGVACIILGAGLLVVATALLVVGAAMLLFGAGALLASAALALFSLVLPTVAAYGTQAAAAVVALSGALSLFGIGATLAGVGVLVLSAALLIASVTLLAIGVAALAASIGVIAFGAAILISAAGALVMALALKAIASQMKSIADNAKSAENSLNSMQNSVSIVESGLKAIGNVAKSFLKVLTKAFDDTAGDVEASGQKVGTGFTKGMLSGLGLAPVGATASVMLVNAALMQGQILAYAAGVNLSAGFAKGMRSQLAEIESTAARMVIAADKAIRAKAKIHSPSKLTYGEGGYFVDGFVNSIMDGTRRVWKATQELVSIPTVETPKLALAYGGSLSSEYDYTNNSEYTIEVPLTVDGKQFAKATATYTQAELSKKQAREDRKSGRV